MLCNKLQERGVHGSGRNEKGRGDGEEHSSQLTINRGHSKSQQGLNSAFSKIFSL